MSTIQALLGNDVVDLLLEVRHGDMPTMMILDVVGYTSNVGTSLSTIWNQGGLYTYPLDTPAVISFVSNNALDTAVSIGITGLDIDGTLQVETIVLNGTTAVSTSNIYSRLLKAHTVGTKAYVGTIIATANAVITAKMDADTQTTLFGFATVPKGYTGFILKINASVGIGKEAVLHIVSRPKGGVFVSRNKMALYQATSPFPVTFDKFDELTDIEMRGISVASGAAANVSGSILLVKNV